VYQDPFCMLEGSSDTKGLTDSRYAIHSFAILHGQLYIFSSTAMYNVSLDQPGPPFQVSESLQWTDFTDSLINMMYKTSWMTSRIFTTVGIELNDTEELLVVGYQLVSDSDSDLI